MEFVWRLLFHVIVNILNLRRKIDEVYHVSTNQYIQGDTENTKNASCYSYIIDLLSFICGTLYICVYQDNC